jgi:hypothetical protein
VILNGWDSFIDFFGADILTPDDISKALGNVVDKTCKFIAGTAAPYIDKLSADKRFNGKN